MKQDPRSPSTGFMEQAWLSLGYWVCRRLAPRQFGLLFERLQIFHAGDDSRIGQYALDYNNPQALCFLIEAYPTLKTILSRYPRSGMIRLLDIGPAFGASAGLLSQMHRSDFLGPRIKVDVLDIVNSRRSFIEMTYPLVNFIHADVNHLPDGLQWDVVYCSNAIEHLDDPQAFLDSVMKHTRGYAVFLAPYKEEYPLSLDHRVQITEKTFENFNVESVEIFQSAAWPTTAEGVERHQILAVLRA